MGGPQRALDKKCPRSGTVLGRVAALLNALADTGHPQPLSRVSRASGLPKSTTHRLLEELCGWGFVDRGADGYEFGTGLWRLMDRAKLSQRQLPRRRLLPHMINLHNRLRRTINLAVLKNEDIVYVERVYGHDRVPSPSDDIDRAPAHATAAGKLLLAHRTEYTPESLCAMTPDTITDPAELTSQLIRITREGVASAAGELAPWLSCVAAPIIGRTGRPIAAVSVAGLTTTTEAETAISILRREALAMSYAIRQIPHSEHLRDAS